MNRNTDPNDNPKTMRFVFIGLSFLATAAFVAVVIALALALRDK
jgi:F0F1-type ATP synthase membrane subunit c/vacuolar-type H+-ATPase subunit K